MPEFPEEQANRPARLESYNKHLYRPNTYLHKWWAPRCGTTFRHILKHFVDDPSKRDFYRGGVLEGKDIVIEWADPLRGLRRLYVECKHWQARSVGRREIQVLHSAVVANPQVDEGVLVTTGRFTHGAIAYAEQVGVVQLIDGKKLRELRGRDGM